MGKCDTTLPQDMEDAISSEREIRTGNGIRITRRDRRIDVSQGGVRIRHEDKPVTKMAIESITKTDEKELRIAVTEVGCDDIGSVLAKLDYKYTVIGDYELTHYDLLKEYKTVFINCDVLWGVFVNPEQTEESLKRYVQDGGILYISDLSAPLISTAFPGFIEFSVGGIAGQWVDASVVDNDLQRIVGTTIKIYFDLNNWIPIERVCTDSRVYLIGSFMTNQGYKEDKPILVSFKYGKGEVVYTSFHNHQQATAKEQKLIKFFVLKPVSSILKIPVIQLAQSKGLITLE